MTFLFESLQAQDCSIQIVQLKTQLNQHFPQVHTYLIGV
jgi:hypothetical protein